ncbi:hypothetical protein BC937DRAFT_94792 [Endogone sp. FLAS-F59071]|nr:hypothetical protein BC937DRAFT_94792 [Endogone sp. FLAS-F59071]|eukprot:RUS22938.1 hypothetical protein BC937DRAFT_94792 [Endogone sp. FLAS-F59071]
MSTVDAERASYLAFFTDLCNKAHNGDETASKVVSLIVTATREADRVFIHDRDLGTVGSVRETVQNLLEHVGVFANEFRYPEDWPRYLDTKRSLRAEWHRETQHMLRAELDRLLLSSPDPIFDGRPETRREAVRRFVATYSKAIGTHPLLSGLIRTLEMQNREPTLVAWTFLDDVLIQNGPELMKAMVHLLITVMGMTHSVASKQDLGANDPTRETARTWYLSTTMSDHEIRELLIVLPDRKKLTARATGDLQISGRKRPAELVDPRKTRKRQGFWAWLAGLFRGLMKALFGGKDKDTKGRYDSMEEV